MAADTSIIVYPKTKKHKGGKKTLKERLEGNFDKPSSSDVSSAVSKWRDKYGDSNGKVSLGGLFKMQDNARFDSHLNQR